MKLLISIALCLLSVTTLANAPFTEVKLDNPRATMRSFLSAMQDYRKGVETKNSGLQSRIHDAIRCLNLSRLSSIVRTEVGKESAVFLKEFIDRVIVIDYDKIPNNPKEEYWRLKGTELVVSLVDTKGTSPNAPYKISPETVARAKDFYEGVQQKPYLKGSGNGALYKPALWKRYLPHWALNKSIGLSNWQWLGIFASLLLGFVLKAIVEFIVRSFKRLTSRSSDSLKHHMLIAFEHPVGLIAATGFWFLCIEPLSIEGRALIILLFLVKITFSVGMVWVTYNLCTVVDIYLQKLTEKTKSTLDDHLVPLVTKALRTFVLIFGGLLAMQSLGFNVMSIMAGLGLGGLAFALAAKDTAANFFGSLMIVFDRPFKIGDWIKTSSAEGTVEEIGFRSTRIRTFYNSIVCLPNSILANVSIDNMGEREYRRIVLNLGVTYQTTPDQIDDFLEGIKGIIKANNTTRKDYYHVVFTGYGDFSLNILVYYFLCLDDWAEELKEKQNINLEILKLAKKLNVDFAYPTQSLFIENSDPIKPPNSPISP